MNEGVKFVRALQKLKFPTTHPLTSTSFDYLFEDKKVRNFLNDFCLQVEVGEIAILTDEQLNTFDHLDNSVTHIDADMLPEIHAVNQVGCHGNEEPRVCKDEIKEMEDDVTDLKRDRQDLSFRCRTLSERDDMLEAEGELLTKMIFYEETNLQEGLIEFDAQKNEMAGTLGEINKQLVKIFGTTNENAELGVSCVSESKGRARHLSQLDLSKYLSLEKSLLSQVRTHCIDNICELPKVGDSGLSEIEDWNREYQTLSECVPESQKWALVTKASRMATEMSLHVFENSFYKEQQTNKSHISLRQKIKYYETCCQRSKNELEMLFESELPEMVKAHALQKITVAGYHLRQEQLNHLDQLIQQEMKRLAWQQVRLEMVDIAVGQECQQQENFNSFLQSMQKCISRQFKPSPDRISALKKEIEKAELQEVEEKLLPILTILPDRIANKSSEQVAESILALRKRHSEQAASTASGWQDVFSHLSKLKVILQEMDDQFKATRANDDAVRKLLKRLSKNCTTLKKLFSNLSALVSGSKHHSLR